MIGAVIVVGAVVVGGVVLYTKPNKIQASEPKEYVEQMWARTKVMASVTAKKSKELWRDYNDQADSKE